MNPHVSQYFYVNIIEIILHTKGKNVTKKYGFSAKKVDIMTDLCCPFPLGVVLGAFNKKV